MADLKNNRRRGATLTAAGYRKLQAAKTDAELAANDGDRYTKEELSTLTGLSIKTISKIFDRAPDPETERSISVDKQTLNICFTAFNLVLERQDYVYPESIVLPFGTLREQTGSANAPDDLEQSTLRENRVNSDSQTLRSVLDSDWGEAPDVSVFYGRVAELTKLATWVNKDRCKLVFLLGMGGIGKTALATKLAQQLQPYFATVVWRSLRHAPPLQTLLPEIIQTLSSQAQIVAPTVEISTQISHLLDYLRQKRCLLVLDNAEAIIHSQSNADRHHLEYPGYAELFERIGSSPHQSCLVVTSREKPAAIVSLEGEKLPVRTSNIAGLNLSASEALFDAKGLSKSAPDRERLQTIYSGNPLVLNIVATSIYDLFDGAIDKFLDAEVSIFSGIQQLLDQQFNRLTPTEQAVMYCLAIERNWFSLADLHDRLLPATTKTRILSTLESLGWKSLIEHNRGKFTQQAMVMEYMTARTIDRMAGELTNWHLSVDRRSELPLWLSYPLLAAYSPKYIHAIQTRTILKPIASQLQSHFGSKLALAQHLKSIIASLQTDYRGVLHYGGGNSIDLLRYLDIDLNGYNFANLPILQVSFQGAILHNVNFSGANLSKSIFTHNFGGVSATAFSPDSQLVVSGEYNGNLYLCRVDTKRLKFKLQGHTNLIWSIAFSPDGRVLASASQDATIRLWDVNTGQVIHVLQADRYHVFSLSFSPAEVDLPSGKAYVLATAHGDGAMSRWNVTTGEQMETRSRHPKQVVSVRFSPDGQLLATGSDDCTVKIWDAATGDLLHTLTEHTKRVWAVRFSPDGKLLATCSGDGTIRLWDVATWTVFRILTGYRNWLFAIEFSPDSQLLAIGNIGNVVKILNLHTDRQITTLRAHSSWVSTLNFSPDGKLLLTASGDRTAYLWDTNTWQELFRWQGYSNWIESVAFHPTGTKLVTGGQDGIAREWDIDTTQIIQTFAGHQLCLWSVDYSPDGRSIVSGSGDSTVKLWNAENGDLVKTFSVQQGDVWNVKFSPDGRFIAGVSEHIKVCLWSVTGELFATLIGHPNVIRALAFSPISPAENSQLLATGSCDSCWRLWDVQTSQMLGCYTGHTNWIWDLTFSPDGRSLATCSADLTVKLWDVATGNLLKTFEGHQLEALSVKFSPNGQYLATGNSDRTIRIWEIETGQVVQTLTGHLDRVLSVSYHPDGKLLASGSRDDTIKLWDLATGECIHTYKPLPPYAGMDITGATGLTPATLDSLQSLGAIVGEAAPTEHRAVQ
jgi:WD40 repeat protein